MTGAEKRFNWTLFVFAFSIIFVFASTLMTSFMTFSVLEPPEIDFPEFSMEAFQFEYTLESMDSFFAPLFGVILIALPVLSVVGAIWAVVVGQINEAIKSFTKIFLVVVFMMVVVVVFDMAGLEIIGLTDAVKTVTEFYLNTVNDIYTWLADFFGGNTGGGGVEFGGPGYQLPGDPYTDPNTGEEKMHCDMDENGVIDWWEEFICNVTNPSGPTYSALTGQPYFFQIVMVSAIPLLIALLNFMFSLIFLSETARSWMDAYFAPLIPDISPVQEFHLLDFNYKMGFFAIIITFMAWMMALNFAGLYRETGILEYSYILFISIYMAMIVLSVVLLSFPNVTIYTKSNWKNTLVGTTFGLLSLFLSFQFLTGTEYTFSAYEYEYADYTLLQILNTFTFVAPAESFFFHILIPSFCLGMMYNRSKKRLQEGTALLQEESLEVLNNKIDALTELKDVFNKGTYERVQIIRRLRNLKRDRNRLKTMEVNLSRGFMFQDPNVYALFFVVILAANFGFSISHWVLSGMNFYIFWLSGLGIIYLVGGCIMTFIGWRFGWFSAISTHAIYNISTLLTLAFFAVV